MRLLLPEKEFSKIKQWEYAYSEEEKDLHTFLDERERQLKAARKNLNGINVDDLFKQADEDCAVRELITDGKGKGGGDRVLVENEELGLRGTSAFVRLGENNWRAMFASKQPFIKVLTAIGLIFDSNIKAFFKPGNNRMKNLVEVWKQLYEDSWASNYAKEVFRNFIFDIAKYPYAVIRTYIKQKTRILNEIVSFDDKNNKFITKEKKVEENTEVIRERLDPKRVWLDSEAKFNRPETISDWLWEQDYSWDKLVAEFGDEPMFKHLSPQLLDEATSSEDDLTTADKQTGGKLYTVQFYENYWRDRFVARLKVSGKWVAIFNDPLPQEHKELSCVVTSWFPRTPDTIAGVAVIEMMRGDKSMRNQIKNMSLDQLTLHIFGQYFTKDKRAINGGQNKMVIDPGVIREGTGELQEFRPSAPGQDAKLWMEIQDQEIADATGIQKVIEGEVQGGTAYETSQAKESALKRLIIPRDNLIFALSKEARLTTDLMYQAYTIPVVEHLVNPEDIKAYLEEVESDPRFYEQETDETGQINFYTKKYKQFTLNAKKDQGTGMWDSTGKDRFFHTMLDFIRWNGDIQIDPASMFSTSKELDKANVRALSEIVLQYLALAPQIAKKPLMKLLERNDENPREWLPDGWLDMEVNKKAAEEQINTVGGATPAVMDEVANNLALNSNNLVPA